MKFLSLIAFSSAVFALNPSTTDMESIVGALSTAFKEIAPMKPEHDSCWKDFGKKPDDGFVSTCPDSLEASMGRCYRPCRAGFKGFGPFCLMQQGHGLSMQDADVLAATSYQRDAVATEGSGMCPANTFQAGDVCVQQDCPKKLSFTCGIVCTKDVTTCSSYVATFTVQIVQLITQLQSGNLLGAVQTLQKIWAQVSSWPKCGDLDNTAGIEEIIAFVKTLSQ